jgi:hypothetical protein
MAYTIKEKYFNWICELIDHTECDDETSYTNLLYFLDDVDFTYELEMDQNRMEDGIDLRYRFGYDMGYSREIIEDNLDDRPCSVLEMMVALSIRCGEDFMDDIDEGNRTGEWFWNMIESLGLDTMTNINYDEKYSNMVIRKFLKRKYAPNGKGGLFTVKNPKTSLRDVEIWYQMMEYLDEYLNLK